MAAIEDWVKEGSRWTITAVPGNYNFELNISNTAQSMKVSCWNDPNPIADFDQLVSGPGPTTLQQELETGKFRVEAHRASDNHAANAQFANVLAGANGIDISWELDGSSVSARITKL